MQVNLRTAFVKQDWHVGGQWYIGTINTKRAKSAISHKPDVARVLGGAKGRIWMHLDAPFRVSTRKDRNRVPGGPNRVFRHDDSEFGTVEERGKPAM